MRVKLILMINELVEIIQIMFMHSEKRLFDSITNTAFIHSFRIESNQSQLSSGRLNNLNIFCILHSKMDLKLMVDP